ncbi:MAG: hypothetical protein LUH02_05850 [Erysipelotrichaceae bacterium]|nr:hypothetical protein [Erysipelotrichaceae bacterium]
MNEKWYFPLSYGSGLIGASDAGKETFKGSLIGGLTREICQNSLDASLNNNKPVKVIFKKKSIVSKEIPEYDFLTNVFGSGETFWDKRQNTKSKNVFTKAKETIKAPSVDVLQISDYNTTGLVGSHENDHLKTTPWISMVTSEGLSDKEGTSGGSFGIGKNAIYACSKLQTAFFSTYDKDKVRGAQGVIKLPSFELNNQIYQGKGFYGNYSEKTFSTACNNINCLDKITHRTESGTDIFILGFNSIGNWQEQIIISLLDNFLLSIFNNKLIVEVDDVIVSKNKLDSLFKQYSKHLESSNSYYNLLKSHDTYEYEKKLDDLDGKATLRFKIFKENANRKVLMSRNNGMKLFDKDHISSSIQFSGILTMDGNELNDFFAKMENPSHTKWQPDRYEDEEKVRKAKKQLKILNDWIKNTIQSIGKDHYDEEIDIEGLEGLIPEITDNSNDKNEALTDKTSEIIYNEPKKSAPSSNIKTIDKGDFLYEVEDTGSLDLDGEYETKGVPINKHSEEHNGEGSDTKGSDGDGNRPIKKTKAITSFQKRIFISDNKNSEYTLVVKTNKTIRNCKLDIFVSSESKPIACKIKDAKLGNNPLKIKNNIIYISTLKKGFSYSIKFSIDTPYICSLGVKLYADN